MPSILDECAKFQPLRNVDRERDNYDGRRRLLDHERLPVLRRGLDPLVLAEKNNVFKALGDLVTSYFYF